MILVFCDGSISNNSMGIGVFVCSAKSENKFLKIDEVLYFYKRIIYNIGEQERHHYEFLSILESLKALKSLPLQKTIIFNDCSNTIELLERLKSGKKKKFKYKDFYNNSIVAKDIQNIHFQWLCRGDIGIQIADKISKPFYHYLGEKFNLESYLELEKKLKLTQYEEKCFSESLTEYNLKRTG